MRHLAFAGVLGLALVAVSGSASGSPAAHGWTLRVGVETEGDVPREPSLAYLYDPVTNATCAKLVNFTSARHLGRSHLYPEVARRLPTLSRDGRTYVFTLRRGFRFSDGSPITAANYAAEFRRILDPAMRSPNAQGFEDVTGVSARGRRLVVTLRKPAGDFLARVAGFSFLCPIPTDLPTDPEGVNLPVRSGPYFVAAYRPNRELVLRRNSGYAGPRRHGPVQIVVQIGMSNEEVAAAVEQGRLDYELTYGSLPDDVVARLKRLHALGRRLFAIPLLKTYYLGFNNSRPLLRGNVALRRAIDFALDRPQLMRALGQSLTARSTDQVLPPAMPGFRNARVYPTAHPDVRRARRLAAGHLRGGRAVLYTTLTRTAAAQAVRQDLARIGLHVQVVTVSDPVYLDAIQRRNGPFDFTIGGWIADYPDPGNFFVSLLQDERWLSVPAVVREASGANALYGRRRLDAFRRLDVRSLVREAWLAPISNPVGYGLVSARVGCVRFAPAIPGTLDVTSLCRRSASN